MPHLARTAQGRVLTPKGYHAIGLKAATANSSRYSEAGLDNAIFVIANMSICRSIQ